MSAADHHDGFPLQEQRAILAAVPFFLPMPGLRLLHPAVGKHIVPVGLRPATLSAIESPFKVGFFTVCLLP